MARYSAVVVLNAVESHADACTGKSAQFHAERTDRELLGRHVARYSAVVVLDAVESHADACIATLACQSHQNGDAGSVKTLSIAN